MSDAVTRSARLLADASDSGLTLIDVGCSGGIAPAWNIFGDSLRALAFDPAREEIERLTRIETRPFVRYINGFVGLAEEDSRKGQSLEPWRLDPWGRLSAYRTEQIQRALAARSGTAPIQESPLIAVTDQDLMQLNRWQEASLTPDKPIVLPDFLQAAGIVDLDFIKIDVDGTDFEILQSLAPILGNHQVLGMALEVNFHGSAEPEYNTFHNIDRFMRTHGFDLFDLTTRKYALAALPRPYLYNHPFAGQTTGGRLFQGDALYLRDLNHRRLEPYGQVWSENKLLKLAALFALFDLQDHAAELVLKFRARLHQRLDIDCVLDIMAAEIQNLDADFWGERRPVGYADYIAAFQTDDPTFYGVDDRKKQALQKARQAQQAALAQTACLQAEIEDRDRRINALTHAAASAENACAQLEAMRRTLSWRLTAPLRALRRRCR